MQRIGYFIWAAAALVIFIGGMLLGALAWHWLRKPGVQIIGTATVVQRVQTLSDLVTVKYVMEKLVILDAPPDTTLGQFVQGDNRMMLLAHGIVKAGVDLKDLRMSDVSVSGKSIDVRLPAAHITDCYLDEDQTKVIDWKTGFLRSFDKNLEQTARQQAVLDIRNGARASGIIKDAEERAEWELAGLLHEAGYDKVTFSGEGAVPLPNSPFQERRDF